MIAEEQDLLALLPQKPPMVMVHQLLACSEAATVSRFRVTRDCVFFDNDVLSESGLVENIAQTAAAGVGFSYQQRGETPPVGFIAAIKGLTVHARPADGVEITTEITVQNQVMDFSIIRGRSWAGDTVFAECEMRIFLKKDS
ncbi:hypothetical protein [Hymenobacter saemangeumensis]